MTSTRPARVIRFDGAENVRDLGGLPTAAGALTRHGVIYRADGLSRLSDADVARLDALGLRSIIDLRYDEERGRAPDRVPAVNPPAFYWRGFQPQGSVDLFHAVNKQGADAATALRMMTQNYSRIPFEHTAELTDVMHYLIAPGNAPHLIHCTSGKDRTGLVAAYVLLAVGVSVDDVVADYELSNGRMQPVDIFGRAADPGAVEVIMQARAEYLRAALDAINSRCGDFETYLATTLAFGTTELARLREMMVT